MYKETNNFFPIHKKIKVKTMRSFFIFFVVILYVIIHNLIKK